MPMVTGRQDTRWGEVVVGIVSPRSPGTYSDLNEIKTFVGQRLANYKLPHELIWVDHVHRSPAGKQDYRWACSIIAAN